MAKGNRDEFKEKTRLQIAKRAGWLCSDPSCRRHTVGSNAEGDGEMMLGTAAHICAAAPGGPRYDPHMTPEQRSSADNGIWMCRLHGTAVDVRDSTFTVELLRQWKAQAQQDSLRRVLYGDAPYRPADQEPSEDELSARLRAAAAADLDVFRRSDKWPATTIPLTLQVDDLDGPVSTSALATALSSLDDLILVAPPGMGKTTTVFQIAEALLAGGKASPIVIPLGAWSTDNVSLLDSILRRSAFHGITEGHLRAVATKPGVVLLLDGWNELDSATRSRATVQIERLHMELPALGLLVATRKQALDVPIRGTRVNLLPLNQAQRLGIARALRGDAGGRFLEQASRTAGLRELVTIPLYLTALLALSEGGPFPTTKEEVLRQFVAVNDANGQHAEALARATHGFHGRFLEELAAAATRAANTTIADRTARQTISETDNVLAAEGQITDKPQPSAVLEALVSHHVLVRASEGYSFQHQQFQEWYASHSVERLMMAGVSDKASRDALQADVLNQPAWEEAILFASERLARGTEEQQGACGSTIQAAFQVDPILAAEMIYRSTDAVWGRIGAIIQGFVRRWHSPGTVDRALRFMITSGRPEFASQVWPLVTHEDDQVRLTALRAARRFRCSVLGADPSKRLGSLPSKLRQSVLSEIASNGGMDGLDLAASVAKADPDPEMKASVAGSLAFRSADRHVAEVLLDADDKTFDLLARGNLIDDVTDAAVQAGLAAARERLHKDGVPADERLRALVDGRDGADRSVELATVIAEMSIDDKRSGTIHLIHEAKKRFPRAVAEGVLRRVREGRTLPYQASELMAGAGFSFEDDMLLGVALAERRFNGRADAAASVLGPRAIGRMIERMFEAQKLVRDAAGRYDEAAADRYHAIQDRIGETQIASLLAAITARSAQANVHELATLARLISRHPDGENGRGQPFDATSLATIAALVRDWGNRLLASAEATREEFAFIATLASHSPSPALLPLLKRLLDEDLRRWRAFREQAEAEGYRGGTATNEARMSWTTQYQRAFDAISSPETAALMREYLSDQKFGHSAALVLAARWRAANEPGDERRRKSGPDFSRVAEKRAARALDPTRSSGEADAIFNAIEPLICADATDEEKRHAVTLAIVAAALPHGQRNDAVEALLVMAERYSRLRLLTALVLSGEIVLMEAVERGIAEVFEAAQKQPWIITDWHELKDWLCLLPFTDRPTDTLAVVRALPEQHRAPNDVESLLDALALAPGDAAENILFQLADADPRLYAHHAWRSAVTRRGTWSAAKGLIDLAAQGVFDGNSTTDQWDTSKLLARLIGDHAKVRAHAYDLLRKGPISPGLMLVARAVAENPDSDGLVVLLQLEIEHRRAFASWLTIETVVTEHVPVDGWQGAYNILPAPAAELRRKLLAMTTDGGTNDSAARYLNRVDKVRDEYGIPDSEPRHPDLASGKAWPIMAPDPDANETG